jgi:hypothetical protein
MLAMAMLVVFVQVKAGHAGSISVTTCDATTGQVKDTFLTGENLKTKAQSSSKPLTIVIKDPDGVVVGSETADVYTYERDWVGIAAKQGWCTVEVTSPIDSYTKTFATTYFQNVIAEVPIGTATIAVLNLLALGFFGVIRRRK